MRSDCLIPSIRNEVIDLLQTTTLSYTEIGKRQAVVEDQFTQ
jgi:hypothetical protein